MPQKKYIVRLRGGGHGAFGALAGGGGGVAQRRDGRLAGGRGARRLVDEPDGGLSLRAVCTHTTAPTGHSCTSVTRAPTSRRATPTGANPRGGHSSLAARVRHIDVPAQPNHVFEAQLRRQRVEQLASGKVPVRHDGDVHSVRQHFAQPAQHLVRSHSKMRGSLRVLPVGGLPGQRPGVGVGDGRLRHRRAAPDAGRQSALETGVSMMMSAVGTRGRAGRLASDARVRAGVQRPTRCGWARPALCSTAPPAG